MVVSLGVSVLTLSLRLARYSVNSSVLYSCFVPSVLGIGISVSIVSLSFLEICVETYWATVRTLLGFCGVIAEECLS